MLTDDALQRYSRQLLLAEVDLDGQEALAAASVLIVGAGGLGNPAALYLAGAGVGRLTLVDGDRLEVSNLHRQIAFRESQCGDNKADALAQQLRALNAHVDVETVQQFVDRALLDRLLPTMSVVLDCTDNFATRLLVNEACVAHRVPLVSGAAIRLEGQLAVFDLRRDDAACYACLYGDGEGQDELCSQSGVLGPVVGMIGTLQALEAIKLLCGHASAQVLYQFDGKRLAWRELAFRRDPACPVCGDK